MLPRLAARDALADFGGRDEIETIRKIEPFDSVPQMQRRLQVTTARGDQQGANHVA